jgi:hypothetical protein
MAIPQSASTVRVSWDASTGAQGYKVQRSADVGGVPTDWGESTAVVASPHVDFGLSAATTYWYRVAASNAAGDSPFSSPATVTTQTVGGGTGGNGGGAITTIPEALSALAAKRIFFAHASVGGNILGGLQTILDGNSGAEPGIVTLGNPPAPSDLHLGDIGETGWGSLNQHPWEKIAAFQSFMVGTGLGGAADIAMMKFCFVDFDAGATSVETNARAQELFHAYQAMVIAVQTASPGVKLVHFTAPLTQRGNGRREAFNGMVRSTYGAAGRVFDLADLESNGHTDAEGRVLDPAYAVARDDDHLNAAGKAVAARALLLFLANLP